MAIVSKVAEKCQLCRHVDKCDHKRMEACAYFEDKNIAESYAMPTAADLAESILRETQTICINGVKTEVYKDEIEKALYKHLYDGLYCNFINGA